MSRKKTEEELNLLRDRLTSQSMYYDTRISTVANNWTGLLRTVNANIDAEHNRISVLAPKVDMLRDKQKIDNLLMSVRVGELENQLACLLKVVKTSGIVEEAVKGEDIFQFRNTVDALQRYPLYKINKVVTK